MNKPSLLERIFPDWLFSTQVIVGAILVIIALHMIFSRSL